MGQALLAGWIGQGVAPQSIRVIEPQPVDLPPGVIRHGGVEGVPADFAPEIVLLAVKPQVMDQVLPPYARFAGKAAFLSIAAGKTIAGMSRVLGGQTAIVRAMPNTPAAIGRGITVACANAGVTSSQRQHCARLLEAVGAVEWADDEGLIDAVTAVSGSGPAYVFWLAECLAEAGRKAGLPADLAERLARATVAGSGELLHRAAETPARLRENVTSPGGTTAAALAVLMAEDGLKPLMERAVAAATRRSRELAG
jgi:pyrroline-5-carboxylate reductase